MGGHIRGSPEPEQAERDERPADRGAGDSRPLSRGKGCGAGQPAPDLLGEQCSSDAALAARDLRDEPGPQAGRDPRPSVPAFLGRGAGRTPRTAQRVGRDACRLDVVAGPASGFSAAACDDLSDPGLEAARAALDAAIVPRCQGRAAEVRHRVLDQGASALLADEGRTVVGLDDQRQAAGRMGAVLGEQGAQGGRDRPRGLRLARQSQEQTMAGQVADQQDAAELAVDGAGGPGEVGGPDGAGRGPDERLTFGVLLGDDTVSQRSQGRTGDPGEHRLE